MLGICILIVLSVIFTGIAVFLVVRDTVKNIIYEEVEVFEDDEVEEVTLENENISKEKNSPLRLVEKNSQSKYDYVYNNEIIERPKLEVVSGYSKKRIK